MKRILFLCLSIVLLTAAFSQSSAAQKRRPVPQAGVWTVRGNDIEKTTWKATMRLTRSKTGRKIILYKGYFDWRSTNGKTVGREYFNGRFNRSNGILQLTTTKVKNINGELGKGWYAGRVTRKGTRIGGTWGGVNVVPGTWSARRVGEK